MGDYQVRTNKDDSSSRIELFEKVYENISWRNVTKRPVIGDNPYSSYLNLCCDPVGKDSLSRPYTASNKREKRRLEVKERQLTKEFKKQMQTRSIEQRKVSQRLAELEGRLSCRIQSGQHHSKQPVMINAKHVRYANDPPDTDNVYQMKGSYCQGNSNCLEYNERSLTGVTLNGRAESASQLHRHSGDWIAVKPQPTDSLQIRPATKAQSVNTCTAAMSGARREKMACNATPIQKRSMADTTENDDLPTMNFLISDQKLGISSGNGFVNQASTKLEKLSLKDDKSIKSSYGHQRLKVSMPVIDGEEDDTFSGEMRPRARTIPSCERRTQPLSLPEIKVEDFSDNPKNDDQDNADKGSFHLFASPPRRRAFTCPDDMFRRKKNARPPTPPPFVTISGQMKGKTKFTFQRKKLFKVTEDTTEALTDTVPKRPVSQNIFSKNTGIFESPGKGKSSTRPTNGYLFTGARKYISRSACGLGNRRQETNTSVMSMHRAHSITDGELPGVRAWRGRGTELTS